MRTRERLEKLEARMAPADRVEAIEILSVAPTPEGPRYTGDVLIYDLVNGGQRREHRQELAGTEASGKGGRR